MFRAGTIHSKMLHFFENCFLHTSHHVHTMCRHVLACSTRAGFLHTRGVFFGLLCTRHAVVCMCNLFFFRIVWALNIMRSHGLLGFVFAPRHDIAHDVHIYMCDRLWHMEPLAPFQEYSRISSTSSSPSKMSSRATLNLGCRLIPR